MTEIDIPQAPSPLQKETQPSEPPLPTAAQIPLQTFHLPPFPPTATSLKHLTLTSDIKPTEYSDLLATPPDTISLPAGIESLTLELFSLGYPEGFLRKLGQALPGLKALTVFCQLLDGVSEGSRRDAGEFMSGLVGKEDGLVEMHLLDVFCRRGFISGIGRCTQDKPQTLRLLEISYTYRGHSDPGFLERIPGDEIPELVISSLIAVSLRLNAVPVSGKEGFEDPADVDELGVRIPGRRPEGIIPFGESCPGTGMLVRKLTGKSGEEGRDGLVPELKMLDCTLYTLSLDQLGQILSCQKDMAVLSASVSIQATSDTKKSLLQALQACSSLEMIEIVGVPTQVEDESISITRSDLFHVAFPAASEMKELSTHLTRLNSFSMTILRAPSFGSVVWTRGDKGWEGNILLD